MIKYRIHLDQFIKRKLGFQREMSRPQATVIAFLLATFFFYETECLSCYECSVPRYVEGEPQDLTCLTAPWKIPGSVRTCLPHMKACKTKRMDDKNSGRIKSFVRSCSPIGEDYTEENLNYVIYHRYCFTSKCNKDDGIKNSDGELNKRLVAILIQDIQNSGHRIPRQFLSLIFPIFTSIFSKILSI